MRGAVLLLGLALAGCGRAVGDEALGDAAAAGGRWTEAYEAWQRAGDEPGLLATRARKPIGWDAAAMQVKGQPALEPIIRGTYRKGWEIA